MLLVFKDIESGKDVAVEYRAVESVEERSVLHFKTAIPVDTNATVSIITMRNGKVFAVLEKLPVVVSRINTLHCVN